MVIAESGRWIALGSVGASDVILDVGGGSVEEDAVNGDGAGGLAGVGRAAEASVDEGLLVGNVRVEGDGRGCGMDKQGGPGRRGDEEQGEE